MDRAAYDQMRAIEQDHWWFAARRDILASELAALRLGDKGKILEVGCGAGGNLEMLSREGQVTGVEPDEETRAYAQSRLGAPVLAGSLPNGLPDLEPDFDLIAAFDVIEHVEEDAAAVAALARLLKPGGRIMATVPAHPWMWSGHDALHHHKRRYTRAQYLRLFKSAGLKVRKASYFNTLLFPLIAAARLLKPLTGSKSRDDVMPAPMVNKALRTVFAAEAPLIRRMNLPFGVSLLVVAERT